MGPNTHGEMQLAVWDGSSGPNYRYFIIVFIILRFLILDPNPVPEIVPENGNFRSMPYLSKLHLHNYTNIKCVYLQISLTSKHQMQ